LRTAWAGGGPSSVFRFVVAATAILLLGSLARPASGQTSHGIWTSAQELAALPTSGAAWEGVLDVAREPIQDPDVSDQDDRDNVRVLAKALVYARTGDESYRWEVIDACALAIGTEAGGRTLALGRELIAYVVAAELVGLPADVNSRFRAWLDAVRHTELDGRTLVSTHEDRPNNWGTHAGASRMAVALYLGDDADLDRAAQVFKGWLGDRSAYAGFDYGDLSWQADPELPVGVNRAGATIEGYSVDGVLPDDQRRGGDFTWPPPAENYVWGALQGALSQALILERAGYAAWSWEDQALLRAVRWLHAQADFPAEGDDTWLPHLVNYAYGTDFPAPVPSRSGKNMGFTDWTHGADAGERPELACMDGVDNDADGRTDFPDDPGCADFTDTSEDSEDTPPEPPSEPEPPTEPDDPNQPEGPTQPEDPNQPGEPEEPTQPEEPGDPDQPTQPEEPTQPAEPEAPTQPEEPTEPEEPTSPDEPDASPAPSPEPDDTAEPTREERRLLRRLARVERKIATLEERRDRQAAKLAQVEGAALLSDGGATPGRVRRMSRRLERMESRLGVLEAKRASLEADLASQER
jgi:hypothetical protein